MPNPTITIPLDPQTAGAYDSAAPEEKQKMRALTKSVPLPCGIPFR